ncbi:hypothetical protein [Methanopyrus kandleri]|uniref:Uncharacterized domain specific for M.kandleri, MK-11 family n=1 Tax=Methanopyrus kandleri (strain AV19 / DSM 6324 / JCM 9639 / NBRC 100938) TaxID=190192 RepID=Q8TVS5_METKA|nr:hypothetical protein [Methanopyrus kandleri]AAM02526.1 Uncharacterized domain specific for M.kandleri, MK-11 family [Methanopyrus kandleri AV19]
MRRAFPSTVLPVALILLPLPGHGAVWVDPEVLPDVSVKSWLIVEDVHWKEETTWHGDKVLDYVDAEYIAAISTRNPGKPVTLHVLLPPDAEVLEARFYPEIEWGEAEEVPPAEEWMYIIWKEWERVEPADGSEVTWEFLDETWKWTQLDFRVTPEAHDSALVLELRIPAVHRVPDLQMVEPVWNGEGISFPYGVKLKYLYDIGAVEWPVPVQPYPAAWCLDCALRTLSVKVELFVWPDGVFTHVPEGAPWTSYEVHVMDHLMLALGDVVTIDVVGIDPRKMSYEEYERKRAEVVRSEWPRVVERFGFPYVPVVMVVEIRQKRVIFDISLTPDPVEAGSEVTVLVRPRLYWWGPWCADEWPWDCWPEEGVLRFELKDERGSVTDLGAVELLPGGYVDGGLVMFRFRAPEEPGDYTLIVRYEGPYGEYRERLSFTVKERGRRDGQGRTPPSNPPESPPEQPPEKPPEKGGKRGFPVLVPPVIPPRCRARV